MPTQKQIKKPRPIARTRSGITNTLREDVRTFRRELILNAATEIFYDYGYERTSVDDVAAAMSVSKAVVYYNFSSKEEILNAIIERTMVLTDEAIDRGISVGKTPAQRLALLGFLYAAHVFKNNKMFGVYFREERSVTPAMMRRLTAFNRSLYGKVARVLDAGVASGDFLPSDTRLLSFTITGMISMAYHWYREGEPVSRDELCRHYADKALRLAGYVGRMALDEAPFTLPSGEN
jgi:TetR/AcrR family transcriptional regulator, cholesterol catabolism regulator